MRRRRTARCVAWPHSATVKAFSPTRFCLFIACQVLPLFGVTSVGLRLHDVSWGRAPSPTIGTNNEESTNEDRGDPASQEIPADLQDNGVINTSAAASGCNAGVEGSSGGSLKGEEEDQGLRRPYHRTVTALPGKPGAPLLWEPKARTQAQMTT